MWVPKLYLLPKKIEIFGPKTAKFVPKLVYLAKYCHFWPIWSHVRPKNNANKVQKWFSFMWIPKLLLLLVKIGIFGRKTAKFGPKYAYLVILGQILAFIIHLVPCPTNKTMRTRSLIEHTDMCVPDLLVKIVRMFGPRTAIFAPKYAFLGTYRPWWLILCPVGWLVGGCGAGCI